MKKELNKRIAETRKAIKKLNTSLVLLTVIKQLLEKNRHLKKIELAARNLELNLNKEENLSEDSVTAIFELKKAFNYQKEITPECKKNS